MKSDTLATPSPAQEALKPPETLSSVELESAAKRGDLVTEGYLGRQPIYDGRREIQAYELLYRGAARDTAAIISDGDRASAEVMLKAFLEIGLQTVSPSRPVFINYSEPLLGLDPIIPNDRCVIEILETVRLTAHTLASVEKLKSSGYRIALDDFQFSEQAGPFIQLADYVKLDIRSVSPRICTTRSTCCGRSMCASLPRRWNPRRSSSAAALGAAICSRATICANRKRFPASTSPQIAFRYWRCCRNA